MSYFFFNVFIFIITVGILILIHELGHFIAARACGIAVQRFSIGFGYTLWNYRDKKNTEYTISIIPLGGYVKMLNHKEISLSEKLTQKYYNKTFDSKTIAQRTCVILAGPLFNLIFAFLIYWLIFIIGIFSYRPIILDTIPNSIVAKNKIPSNVEIKYIDNTQTSDWESVQLALINKIGQKEISISVTPLNSSHLQKYSINFETSLCNFKTQDIITAIGIIPLTQKINETILSKVYINTPAMHAGLKVGDRILSINNKTIDSWKTLSNEIKKNPNKFIKINLMRKGQILTFNLKPDTKNINNIPEGYIGISPTYSMIPKNYLVIHKFGLLEACQKSGEKIYQLIHLIFNMLIKLITGDIQLHTLGGPISIAQSASLAAEHGLTSYLIFLSLISINLGIINLLPIPILDGGHLVFLIIEKISNKTISQTIEKYTYHIGSILLILLMFLAIFNDLSRL